MLHVIVWPGPAGSCQSMSANVIELRKNVHGSISMSRGNSVQANARLCTLLLTRLYRVSD